MRYGSVCSGIEAATVAWHPLGWQPQFFSEIEKFPCAVLQHHYPTIPNRGDMTQYKEWDDAPIDVLVGGTPCQSFSVAGLRKGLDDPRGNLALVYLGIAERFQPRWILWENVPGVLSSNGGRDFGAFLGALAQLGYGFAYRVLDAQYFGVPQRRRRVFVVGYLGDWRRAAAVLFERYSLSGHPPPRRETGQRVARSTAIGIDEECNAIIDGFGPLLRGGQGGTRQAVMTEVAHGIGEGGETAHALTSSSTATGRLDPSGETFVVSTTPQVRRLTPRECERLQGIPDDYTNIPWRGKPESPDGPRYKALGNSMAVPVMRWIAKRMHLIDMF